MRSTRILALTAFAAAALAPDLAGADDRLHLTPPLYREQARDAQMRRAPAPATTPQPVPAAGPGATAVRTSPAPATLASAR